jgi:hypothetical protein
MADVSLVRVRREKECVNHELWLRLEGSPMAELCPIIGWYPVPESLPPIELRNSYILEEGIVYCIITERPQEPLY